MIGRFILFIISLAGWNISHSQAIKGCHCGDETLFVLEVAPQQPVESISFKKQLSKYIDTLLFCGKDTGFFIVKFSIDRCGDMEELKTIVSTTDLYKEVVSILPKSGKWRPARNSGKIWCVYVALKFEMYNGGWHIKRLNPYTYQEDPLLTFFE